LSQAFAMLDTDASTHVTWDEFVRGINLCLENTGNHRVSTAELWPIFKKFDRNNDDRISLEEFTAQFLPQRRGGSAGRSWYEDDMRMRGSGRMVGIGPAVVSTEVMNTRRVDDVICRIGSAIHRMGFTTMQLFQKVDLDHNGRLSWAELERVILSFQPDLSLTERQAIFRRFDQDNSQSVDINEFCGTLDRCNPGALVSMEAKVRALGDKFRATGQTVSDAFRVFDRNMDGLLTRDEWFRAWKALDSVQPVLSDADIDAVFARFDINGDGYMNIHEFDTFYRDSIDRSGASYGTNSSSTYGSPGTASYGTAAYGAAPAASYGTASYGAASYAASPSYGVMPTYVAPPVEQPWETEILDTCRSCLSVGRSGMTITEVYRRLDIDNSQSMSLIEFQRMVSAYRSDLQAAHVDSLFRKVNVSNSGQINLSEFVRRFG